MEGKKIIGEVNALARKLYGWQGYIVDEGYRFDISQYPGERRCWSAAAQIHEQYTGIDVDAVLDEIEEDE